MVEFQRTNMIQDVTKFVKHITPAQKYHEDILINKAISNISAAIFSAKSIGRKIKRRTISNSRFFMVYILSRN